MTRTKYYDAAFILIDGQELSHVNYLIQLSQAKLCGLDPEEANDLQNQVCLLYFSEEHLVLLWTSQLHLHEELSVQESLKLQCEETILNSFKHPSPVI